MASKKSYSRYFIILQEDERGYGLAPGKAPTGYAKIEIKNSKCKISYYVQNLKPGNNKYCMLLICGKKGCQRLINIGNIVLDEQGRADLSYEYDVQNIGNSNIAVDKIIGAAIGRMVDSNVISLMSGFTTTEIPNDWKTYSIVNVNSNRDEKTTNEENIFDKYEKKIEGTKKVEKKLEVEDNHEESNIEAKNQDEKNRKHETIVKEELEEEIRVQSEKSMENEEKVCKEAEEDKKVENKKKREDEKTRIEGEEKRENKKSKVEDKVEERIEENNIEIKKEEKEKIEHKEEVKNELKKQRVCSQKSSMEEFFENLGHGMDKYWDIFPNIKKSVWYKVDIKDVEDICDMSNYDKYVVMYYPMINYYSYIKEYKHYLVGYKYDDDCKIKYMMYAIPGSKSSKCQPFDGKTGFVTWMKASNLGENEGYWIMFYDFRNSNILIPMKKNK